MPTLPKDSSRNAVFLTFWAVATTLFAFYGVLSGKVLYFRDLSRYFVPGKLAATRAILGGEWPFWDPFVYTGTPLLAQLGLAIGYPLNVLFLFFDPGSAITLYIVIHYPAALFGMYYFLRSIRMTPLAAATGGTAYAWTGIALCDAAHPSHIAILAIAPFFLALPVHQRGRGLFGFAALIWALACSTGSAERLLSLAVLATVFAATVGIRRAATMILSMAFGTLLTAPLWLPSLFYLRAESTRAGGLDWITAASGSVSPIEAMSAFLPISFVSSSGAVLSSVFDHGFPLYPSIYLGGATALLATAALGDRPRRRATLFWVAVVAVTLLVSMGRHTPVYHFLWNNIPPLKLFRYPVKHWSVAVFGTSVLCAIGAEYVVRSGRRALVILTTGVIAITGVFCASAFRSTHREFLESNAGAVAEHILPFLLLLVVIAWTPRRFRLVPILLPVLVYFDLIGIAGRFAPLTDRSIYHPPKWAEIIGNERFISAEGWGEAGIEGSESPVPRAILMSEGVAPNFGGIWRMRHADGYQGVVPEPRTARKFLSNALAEPDAGARMLGRLGVRWRLVPTEEPPLPPLWKPVIHESTAQAILYENTLALPRVRFEDGDGMTEIRADRHTEVVIETKRTSSGRLLLADAYAPGWSCTVNDVPAEITTTDGMTREIEVPPGRATVRFTYKPPGWNLSLALAGGALLVVSVALVRRRSFPKEA